MNTIFALQWHNATPSSTVTLLSSTGIIHQFNTNVCLMGPMGVRYSMPNFSSGGKGRLVNMNKVKNVHENILVVPDVGSALMCRCHMPLDGN